MRTTLELPSSPLPMAELLRKADELYVTLPTTTVSSISEAPTEQATSIYACDVPAVNDLFRNRGSGKGSTEYKNPSSVSQLCWYHHKFRDQARYCTGLPCPRHRPHLKKGRKSQVGNATGGQQLSSYLTGPFIKSNDSSSWTVSWLTVVRLYQSYRLLQRRNDLPVSPYTTCMLQTDNTFIPSGAEMRPSSSLASLVPMTGLWPCSHDRVVADVVHPILGMDFFQDGEGKRYIIDPRRRCLADRYTVEEFPVDNKTSSVFR